MMYMLAAEEVELKWPWGNHLLYKIMWLKLLRYNAQAAMQQCQGNLSGCCCSQVDDDGPLAQIQYFVRPSAHEDVIQYSVVEPESDHSSTS